MKSFVSVATAVLLLAIGYVSVAFSGFGSKTSWNPDDVYAVWIEGVEVSPNAPNGDAWNRDGKAPNLKATLSWRDNVVLETPEAPRGLIARWDRTAVKIKNLLKTELAPNAMENVGRIHARPEEVIVIEVRDQGLLSSRWVGALCIPCGKLRPGLNVANPTGSESTIQSLSLRVVPSSILEKNGRLPEDKNMLLEGVVVMPSPEEGTDIFQGRAIGKKIQEGIKDGVKAVSELLQNANTKP